MGNKIVNAHTPVHLFASAAIGDKIYIVGGANNEVYYFSEMAIDKVQIYDCNTNIWSYGAPLPNSLCRAAAVATSGIYAPQRLYVMGGIEANAYNYTLIYNPETNTWSNGTDMPTPRGLLGVANVNDQLYALGGSGKTNSDWSVAVNERYTPFDYSVGQSSDNLNENTLTTTIIAGVAVAGTVIAVTGITVYHFKHVPSKAAKPT